MLVVMGIDLWSDNRAVGAGFALRSDIDIEDTSEARLEFDRPVYRGCLVLVILATAHGLAHLGICYSKSSIRSWQR